jgi:hypothetical protein
MWDTCAIDLRVNVPSAVAHEIRQVEQQEPELLSRMLMYALARRRIFDHLSADAIERKPDNVQVS